MSNKTLSAIILIAAFLSRLVCAEENEDTFPNPSLDSIHKESASVYQSHCASNECQTIETIAEAMDILLAAQATTMDATTPYPANRDRLANIRLDGLLLEHPEKFASVCNALTRLAQQYPPGDSFVAVSSMQLALRMDIQTTPNLPGACLPELLHAFPKSKQADTAISNAEILCLNAWNLGNACSRLHR